MPSAAHVTVPQLNEIFSSLSLGRRLEMLRAEIEGRIAFTTSFGLEDQLLSHEIFSRNLEIDVVTLDTGRLFPETYRVWSDTEERYGKKIRAFFPDRESVENYISTEGVDGFRNSISARRACCFIRKIRPLGRALKDVNGWITGLRSDQSHERSHAAFVSYDDVHSVIKLNPLLDWTREKVADAVHANRIPYNPLQDHGFLSIGCAPCTRAVASGEPERAGRWWWEEEGKKECGLHTSDAMKEREGTRREKIFSHLETSV